MKKLFKFGLMVFLSFAMILPMTMVPTMAETVEILPEMVFDNTANSRVDITSMLPSGENDTMIWKGEFKTSDSAIQTLVSVCNADANQYLTLYVNRGTTIGFEFKGAQTAAATASVSYLDNNYHSFMLTVSPKGYELVFDGEVVISNQSLAILTSMNSYTNKNMYLGGMKRQGGAADSDAVNWYFNGTIRNVEIEGKDSTRVPVADLLFSGANLTSGNEKKLLTNEVPDFMKTMEQGTFTFTYRLDNQIVNSAGLHALFSMMDTSQNDNYATFYVKPSTGQFGVEVKGGIAHKYVNFDVDRVRNTQWHTVTFAFDGTQMNVTLDDLETKSVAADGFIKNASWALQANALFIGGMQRTANQWYFDGYMGDVRVYQNVLSQDDIALLHSSTASATYPNKTATMIKGDVETIYAPGYKGSAAYRIPSLLTTSKGTVIAGIDQRHDGLGDWYNIDSMIRRKEIGATDFDEPIKVIDLIDFNNQNDVFLIDMSLMEAKMPDGNHRVYMLVDMFPQSLALIDSSLQIGSGYVEKAGQKYLAVYDDNNVEYTVRENGHIYDTNGNDTGYVMERTGNASLSYRDLGTITDKDGKEYGNAFVYSGTAKGKFHVLKTSYLWLTYSDDDGKTWSSPKDLNAQVKEEWMKFLGSGPGVGIQLSDDSSHPGRLVYPVYHSNVNLGGSQASAVIVSDDYGETWTLKTSPVQADGYDPETMNNSLAILTESQVIELNNNTLKLFMRNYSGKVKVSTSTDGGDTWSASQQINVYDSYCQMSTIHTNYNGKEYVILSNPSASGRQNLTISVGEVNGNDITWISSHLYHSGHGQYSCLSEIEDGKIAVLYEGHRPVTDEMDILYTTFTMDYLLSDLQLLSPEVTNIVGTLEKKEGNPEELITTGDVWKYTVTLNKPVFVSGIPSLLLNVAGEERTATYISGNGTAKMTFEYVVSENDRSGQVLAKKTLVIDENEVAEDFYNFAIADLESYVAVGRVGFDFSSNIHDLNIVNATSGSEVWGATVNGYDKNTNTFWHSADLATGWITLDLGAEYTVEGIRYLARQDTGTNGIITEYNLYVGSTLDSMEKVVSNGTWGSDKTSWKGIELDTPVTGRYVKLEAVAGLGNFASAAEVAIFGKELVVIDKTALNEAIANAEVLNENDYTPESWAVLSEALTNAKALTEDATQDEVDAALAALNTAIDALEEKTVEIDVNKTTLSIAVELANEVTEEDLSKVVGAVVKEFKAALENANTVLANESATQEEADAAFDRLANVMWMLEFKRANVEQLKAFVESQDLEGVLSRKDEYIESTWASFEEEYNAVKAIIADENEMDQAKVNEAFNKLVKAFLNLRLIPNKDKLAELVVKADQLNANAYTEVSYAAVDRAMIAARIILANEEATSKDIETAYVALDQAIKELKVVDKAEASTTKPAVKIENVKLSAGNSVKTADNTAITLFSGMMLVSLAGACLLKKKED